MGLFDISTQKSSHNIEKKDEIIASLKESFSQLSDDVEIENNQTIFKKFKAEKTLLTYDLKIVTNSNKETFSIDFEGELLNLWILVILIIVGILFTYGMGTVLVAVFAYYQKKVATKYIEENFEKIKKEFS